MTDRRELIVGAVAYSPNVVPIWEGIRDYFADSAAPMDFVLFSNYERQVEALLAGHIDIAWNTNVAWIRTLRRTNGTAHAVATRDTDLVFTTLFVGRRGSGLVGLESLAGQRVAVGSRDSGQARILPLYFMARAGVTTDDVDLIVFDSDVGKHGDTGRSDLDALRGRRRRGGRGRHRRQHLELAACRRRRRDRRPRRDLGIGALQPLQLQCARLDG